jgi:Scaffold protein Nfu/NifU N terminal
VQVHRKQDGPFRGPFFFENREQAAGSPLVERLFELAGVAHVLVAGNVVTVGVHRAICRVARISMTSYRVVRRFT